jgi:group I intron endonuclease
MMGIYQIKNIQNDKVYIGNSSNIMRRWETHINNLKYGHHHSHKLQEDWNKYGYTEFSFSILELVKNKKDLPIREQEYLDRLDMSNAYNIIDFANYKSISATKEFIEDIHYCINLNKDMKSKLINNINIIEKTGKLSLIGNNKYDLSKTWFIKNTSDINKLKLNMLNYFKNRVKAKSKEIAWTSFTQYYSRLKEKMLITAFVPLNGSIDKDKRNNICFVANCFMNDFIRRKYDNINIDDDTYALSILLKWIVNVSDINKKINIYIPSSRMENILKNWMEENKQQHL